MRKFLLFVLATLVLSMPAFSKDAQQNDEEKSSEIVLKLGIAPVGQINTKETNPDGNARYDGAQYADNTGFYLGAEYYYYVLKYLGLGAGVNYQFSRHIKHFGDAEILNAYISIKPKIEINKPLFGSKEYLYALFQGGYGFQSKAFSIDAYNGNNTMENGLFYAAGVGLEWSNIILEFMFRANLGKITGSKIYSNYSMETTYSTMNINLGYKFGF